MLLKSVLITSLVALSAVVTASPMPGKDTPPTASPMTNGTLAQRGMDSGPKGMPGMNATMLMTRKEPAGKNSTTVKRGMDDKPKAMPGMNTTMLLTRKERGRKNGTRSRGGKPKAETAKFKRTPGKPMMMPMQNMTNIVIPLNTPPKPKGTPMV